MNKNYFIFLYIIIIIITTTVFMLCMKKPKAFKLYCNRTNNTRFNISLK